MESRERSLPTSPTYAYVTNEPMKFKTVSSSPSLFAYLITTAYKKKHN